MRNHAKGMNDIERRLWVLNDERLYNWYRSEQIGLYAFINRHRKELTEIINKGRG